jgi:hypothetical protein
MGLAGIAISADPVPSFAISVVRMEFLEMTFHHTFYK